MISSNVSGTAAYAAIQNGFQPDDTTAGDSGQPTFGAALQGAISNLTQAGQEADATSAKAMMGKGDLTDVVTAVSKAEMALQTSVAVRDRMISAYQDIMRMAV